MSVLMRRSLLGLAVLISPALASAQITKMLNVNVWRVCDNAGLNCARTTPTTGNSTGDQYFALAANTIFAQAGIGVTFNFVGTKNNSAFLNNGDFNSIVSSGNHYQSATQMEMFLVNTLNNNSFGTGWLGLGGLVIAMDPVLNFNNNNGRLDTVAHEMGHNLGLVANNDPDSDGSGHSTNPNQLMASGGIRNVPTSRNDIFPSGLGYDRISQFQINSARQSRLLRDVVTTVPEPGTVMLVAFGMVVVGVVGRRRASAAGA
jgi:hypothetical protein